MSPLRQLSPEEKAHIDDVCHQLLNAYFAYAFHNKVNVEVLMMVGRSIVVTTWMNGLTDGRYDDDARKDMKRQLVDFAGLLMRMAETTTESELLALMHRHADVINDHHTVQGSRPS